MVDVLIIGKNGQLGKELVNVVRKNNLSLVALSREELDVTKYQKIEKKIKKIQPRIIINTSAYHVTTECEKNPLTAFEVNSVAVGNLAKLSKEIGANFVTYSTNYVFDGKKKSPYSESDIPNPLQMYGLSKFAGEINALNYYPSGTFVIRTCGVFGGGRSGSKSKKGNYILKILSEAKNNSQIQASKKQIVNPTYALDLAESTFNLLRLNANPGVYHLVNEGSCNWYDFANKILEYKGIKKVKIIAFKNDEENRNFSSPLYSVLGNLKAKKIGIILPSIDDGLRRYLREL